MPQRKACIPCASSKRKCDRQLPGCERCMKRDVECVYSQRKKRRSNAIVDHVEDDIELEPLLSDAVNIGNLDTMDWNSLMTNGFDLAKLLHPNDLTITTLPSLESAPTWLDCPVEDVPDDTARPWYLRKDTWELQHHIKDPDCVLQVNYDLCIIEVRSMLRSWSTAGHNEFIHRKLYGTCMPQYIQEAFTMLAAYSHCNADVKSTVLQIAEDQSCRLIQHETSKTGDSRDTLDHLARVHALFAYVFVRLFDGSVRLRVSAEKQIPILRSWVSEMIEEVSRLDGTNPRIDNSIKKRGPIVFDAEFHNVSEQWNTWLLAESVRRTHVILNTILNVYLCLSVGAAECSGFLMLTARHGLWQAESSSQWSKIISSESPLLISIANPGQLIAEYPATEFDEVLISLWKYMVGPEEIQRWVEKGRKLIG